MNYRNSKLLKIGACVFSFIMLIVLMSGCLKTSTHDAFWKAPTGENGLKAIKAKSAPRTNITGIVVEDDSESINVMIRADQKLIYTSVKQPSPPGVVLYFPKTALALENTDTDLIKTSEIIEEINTSEQPQNGGSSRVEIVLNRDSNYDVRRQGNGLSVSFPKVSDTSVSDEKADEDVEPPADTPEVVKAATVLNSIEAEPAENSIKIFVKADGTIKDYKTFTINNPARIVFDIFNIQYELTGEKTLAVNSKWIKSARYYGHPDRVRLVLDTIDAYISSYSATPVQDGLMISVGTDASITAKEKMSGAATQRSTTVKGNKGTAWVNRLDFSSGEQGKSTIIIGTTFPVKYEVDKPVENKIQIKLLNTNIPDYRKRPLITTRFESAVDRIIPVQIPAMTSYSIISVELRETVPYLVEQTDNLLMIHFEASTVPPKTIDEAQLPAWKKVIAETVTDQAPDVAAAITKPTEEPVAEDLQKEAGQKIAGQAAGDQATSPMAPKKFVGEKIALDFYNTDIKNVFRILREVSGKNYAIDKDVSGSVTLSFDKPVPWDQVLDLVLRMNGLGMVYEGDIIRIATLATIKAEEDLRRSQVANQTKAREEEIALQPVITKYIPINYASAADILSHIITTEGRGSVTVDERNNQIIITDVPEKIKLAEETIKRIDTVTPQVLIEARVVEATKTFSQEIGTTFGTPTTPDPTSSMLGGVFDYSVTSNFPKSALGAIGITFSRIAGSGLTLAATINALEVEGESKTISAPKILTLDNKQASIKQGVTIPINKIDADGNTVTEFKDIALTLDVTPHVTPDERISMTISIQKNDIGSIAGTYTLNDVKTELLVNDGDTVVIGGVVKRTDTQGEQGLPGLRKIPLLGWIFKSKQSAKTLTELLIFITPRIVRLDQASD